MNDGKLVRAVEVLHGEVLDSDEAYLAAVYDNSGTEAALARYVDTHSDEDSQSVEEHLARFCGAVADAALKDDEIDVGVVRAGFEIVTDSMNEVASRKYGYEREYGIRSLLVRAGVRTPQSMSYVRTLDDRYWESQFLDQHESGDPLMPSRQPDETDQEYLARYTFASMRGLLFAYFQLAV